MLTNVELREFMSATARDKSCTPIITVWTLSPFATPPLIFSCPPASTLDNEVTRPVVVLPPVLLCCPLDTGVLQVVIHTDPEGRSAPRGMVLIPGECLCDKQGEWWMYTFH